MSEGRPHSPSIPGALPRAACSPRLVLVCSRQTLAKPHLASVVSQRGDKNDYLLPAWPGRGIGEQSPLVCTHSHNLLAWEGWARPMWKGGSVPLHIHTPCSILFLVESFTLRLLHYYASNYSVKILVHKNLRFRLKCMLRNGSGRAITGITLDPIV